MLSRLAESLYWIGRYMERAENTARLLNVNYYAALEAGGQLGEEWVPLLAISGTQEQFGAYYGRPDSASAAHWLAFDRRNPSSIASSLSQARENARGLRDYIPSEMWEYINRVYHDLCFDTEQVMARDGLFEYCTKARDASQFFFGIAFATLPRNEGWSFMRAGQLLERGDNVLRLLQVRYSAAVEYQGPSASTLYSTRWVAVLKTVSAYESYRKSRHSSLQPQYIMEFLLLSPQFPRSVRYSAENLRDALEQIERIHPGAHPELLREANWLLARLEHHSVDEIVEGGGMDKLLIDFNAIGMAITQAYFDAS